MITKMAVKFNDVKIPVKGLLDYAKMFYSEPSSELVYAEYKNGDTNVEVVYGVSTTGDFDAMSFVNGIHTQEGGLHVDAFVNPLAKKISDKFVKQRKTVSTRDVKGHLRVWVNAVVPNPQFNNQSKNKLTGPYIKPDVSTTVFNKVSKWSFVEEIELMLKSKELVALKGVEKKNKTFKAIKGYDQANNAGKKKSGDCSLILCEGLSAKTFAVTGIQHGFGGKSGRDWYGIYPLRGKGLNVRNATKEAISKNREIVDMIQILNLKFGVDYSIKENFDTLNYGSVIILADSDVDGKHIVGLIMNFFHHMFPSLFKRPGFIINMCTPIVSIQDKKIHHRFYAQTDADKFINDNESIIGRMKVKYLKGLGSSNDKEIKETFGKLVIEYDTKNDKEMDKEMDKVFNQKYADIRKEWLEQYNPDLPEITSGKINDKTSVINDVTISDFLNREMIKFSIDDCLRNIPNVFDGLKISQRKILYASFLKGNEKMKVSQLAGFVSEKTNYHHGEQCLFDTITKMGQDYTGSNNIPLLEKDGQFGSLIANGKDAASARYIFAKQSKIARKIFRPEDDQLLKYVVDDGDKVEPEYYIPIIPMILVNGSTAIATGWSTNIPSFNPKDIIQSVEEWIDTRETKNTIDPWYRNHSNGLINVSDVKYESLGRILKNGKKWVVEELPVGMSIESYKTYLEGLYEDKRIKSLKNYSTPDKVYFEFECDEQLDLDNTKLKSTINLTNMVVFLEHDRLKRMVTVNDIIKVFCEKRLECYSIRKKMQLASMTEKKNILTGKCKFLDNIMNNKLEVFKVKEEDIIKVLKKEKYHSVEGNYDYLLNIPMRTFSFESLKKLETELKKIISEIDILEKTKIEDIWKNELNELKNLI